MAYKSTCCGAETANKQPVQTHIKTTEAKAFDEKKKINKSATQAINCVSAATLEGENLSESFPPR